MMVTRWTLLTMINSHKVCSKISSNDIYVNARQALFGEEHRIKSFNIRLFWVSNISWAHHLQILNCILDFLEWVNFMSIFNCSRNDIMKLFTWMIQVFNECFHFYNDSFSIFVMENVYTSNSQNQDLFKFQNKKSM